MMPEERKIGREESFMSEHMGIEQQSKMKDTDLKGLQKTIKPASKERIFEDVRIRHKDNRPIQLQEHRSKHASTDKNTTYQGVIQAYSIGWAERTQTIDDIILDRPSITVLNERVLFPGWKMSSSHTTAFVVMKRDLELRLKGKTFNRALYEIQQLTFAIWNMPGYKVMPDEEKANIDSKIREIEKGIDQFLQGVSLDAPTGLTEINRNIIINGYAEKYFICRNSIYYTFHVYGNGGGSNNEAGNIWGLETSSSFDEALSYAVALLDKNYEGNEEDWINIVQQHFLSIASFFFGQGNSAGALEFIALTKDTSRMLESISQYE